MLSFKMPYYLFYRVASLKLLLEAYADCLGYSGNEICRRYFFVSGLPPVSLIAKSLFRICPGDFTDLCQGAALRCNIIWTTIIHLRVNNGVRIKGAQHLYGYRAKFNICFALT